MIRADQTPAQRGAGVQRRFEAPRHDLLPRVLSNSIERPAQRGPFSLAPYSGFSTNLSVVSAVTIPPRWPGVTLP